MTVARRLLTHPATRLVVTLALVAFGAAQLDLGRVVRDIAGAEPLAAGAGVLLLLLGQVLSGLRWHALGRRLRLDASPRWYVAAYLRGCFYNSVLPTGIGGDALRVGWARRLGSLGAATRSVLVDRVSGLAALVLAAGVVLPAAGYGLADALTAAAAAVAVAVLAASAVAAARLDLVGWLLWTLAFELVWFLGVLLLASSLGISLGLATPVVVLVVGVAMALPISLGGHGAREAGFVLALAPLGIAATSAVALGVLFGLALGVIGLLGALVPLPGHGRTAGVAVVPGAEVAS